MSGLAKMRHRLFDNEADDDGGEGGEDEAKQELTLGFDLGGVALAEGALQEGEPFGLEIDEHADGGAEVEHDQEGEEAGGWIGPPQCSKAGTMTAWPRLTGNSSLAPAEWRKAWREGNS